MLTDKECDVVITRVLVNPESFLAAQFEEHGTLPSQLEWSVTTADLRELVRAALAAREQEPVAWTTKSGNSFVSVAQKERMIADGAHGGEFAAAARMVEQTHTMPLYAGPMPMPVSDADRRWVAAMREAFADPTSDVNLPQDYFRRLCGIALRDPALAPARSQEHADDLAVDRLAVAMKRKLAAARAKGRGGWENKDECSREHLVDLMCGHMDKGDPVDVANFACFLFNRGESTRPARSQDERKGEA